MTLAFFISGHGFGHASRDVEVLNAFGSRVPEARIIIRSAVSPDLLGRTLRVPYELRPGPCDTGIVQASSVAHDDPATVGEALAFYSTFESRVSHEAQALAGDNVALVVGDIAPLAFAVAARLGVPSVAMGNFTWDWIYETHPEFLPRGAHVLEQIRQAYAAASLALQLPFSDGFDVFQNVTPVPLVARRPTHAPADTRRRFSLPLDRPVALLSFGGYGLPSLDASTIDAFADWTIVTTDRSAGHISRHVPLVQVGEEAFRNTGVRYEDLVAAADVVLTKPGYGIISECVAAGTAMLYTSRGDFREYDLLVREMPRYVRTRFISHADLFGGRWLDALNALIAQPPPPERLETNGAEVVAGILAEKMATHSPG